MGLYLPSTLKNQSLRSTRVLEAVTPRSSTLPRTAQYGLAMLWPSLLVVPMVVSRTVPVLAFWDFDKGVE